MGVEEHNELVLLFDGFSPDLVVLQTPWVVPQLMNVSRHWIDCSSHLGKLFEHFLKVYSLKPVVVAVDSNDSWTNSISDYHLRDMALN